MGYLKQNSVFGYIKTQIEEGIEFTETLEEKKKAGEDIKTQIEGGGKKGRVEVNLNIIIMMIWILQ